MKVINVSLYGGKSIFGGKETALEAEITSCDKYEVCSLYKIGQCAKVRSMGRFGCEHGSKKIVRGYTSRATKYYSFKQEWENHEMYSKIKSRTKDLAIIDGKLYIYSMLIMHRFIDGKLVINSCWAKSGHDKPKYKDGLTVDLKQFETKDLKRICELKPQALFGGVIKSYQEETVPYVLAEIKKMLPDFYQNFIKEYPEHDKEINYVGREAKILTLNYPLIFQVNKDSGNIQSKWEYDGKHLIYISGWISQPNVIKGDIVEYKYKPSDGMSIEIEDNSWVNENTVFVD